MRNRPVRVGVALAASPVYAKKEKAANGSGGAAGHEGAIPEPAALALLGLGVVAALARRRRI